MRYLVDIYEGTQFSKPRRKKASWGPFRKKSSAKRYIKNQRNKGITSKQRRYNIVKIYK